MLLLDDEGYRQLQLVADLKRGMLANLMVKLEAPPESELAGDAFEHRRPSIEFNKGLRLGAWMNMNDDLFSWRDDRQAAVRTYLRVRDPRAAIDKIGTALSTFKEALTRHFSVEEMLIAEKDGRFRELDEC